MSYPLAPSRERRRRRRMWILIGLAVLIAVVALAVRFRTETRDTAAYLAHAKEVADGEQQLADSLAALLENLGTFDRPELMQRIETLSSTADELYASFEDVTVTSRVAEVHGFLLVATDSWRDAIAGLDDGVIAVLESPEGTAGIDVLQEVFELLEVGDRAYEGFEDALSRLDAEIITHTYPAVAFVGPGRSDSHTAAAVARRLGASTGLADRHDVAVTATLDPAPVGDRNGVPVVPFGTTFTVTIVVTNAGNLDEEDIVLEVVLAEVGGEGTQADVTEIIAELGAGQSTTVPVSTLSVEPGRLYEVSARVTIADDADPDNDVWSVLFLRNEE